METTFGSRVVYVSQCEDVDLNGYTTPGWYWFDEVYHCFGPFDSEESAYDNYINYNSF